MEDAAAACERSEQLSADNWLAHYNLACVRAKQGNVAAALGELGQALKSVGTLSSGSITRATLVSHMETDAMLAPVRNDPRFREMAQ